jgi:hypothetical protein
MVKGTPACGNRAGGADDGSPRRLRHRDRSLRHGHDGRATLTRPSSDGTQHTYFGCRAAHLPLELSHSRAIQKAAGQEVLMPDRRILSFPHPSATLYLQIQGTADDAASEYAWNHEMRPPGFFRDTNAERPLSCRRLEPA